MSKKLLTILTALLCLSVIFYGCKSKPETEEINPVDEVAPIEQTSQEETEEQMLARAKDEIEQARRNKERIEGLDFLSYDQDSYEKGCQLLAEYDEKSESLSAKDRIKLAKETNDSFKAVLSAAFNDLASRKRPEVEAARAKCVEVKADKACKEEFASADFQYRAGNEYFSDGKFEMSYDSYNKALIAFNEVYDDLLAKRARADAEIEKAKQKTEEVENFALEADKICPLPEDVVFDESDDLVESDQTIIPEETAENEESAQQAE